MSKMKDQLREANAKPGLEWLKQNLSTDHYASIDRSVLASDFDVSESTITRTIIMLTRKGYLVVESPKTTPLNRYRTNPDLPIESVTPAMLAEWIYEYNVNPEASKPEKKQKQKTAPLLNVPTPEQTTETVTAESFHPLQSAYKPNDQVTQKPRSQTLKEQIQQLQQEAEEEARREAEQAQQQQSGVEMPGTNQELLMLLDGRIDGMERRFDSLEKKVNTVLYFFQQASVAARSLGPVGLPIEAALQPEQPATAATETTQEDPSTRTLLVRLVNSFAAADRRTEHDTWKWLYGIFDLEKGFNVYAMAGGKVRGSDDSYLSIVEQHGKLEELYKVAKSIMKAPTRR